MDRIQAPRKLMAAVQNRYSQAYFSAKLTNNLGQFIQVAGYVLGLTILLMWMIVSGASPHPAMTVACYVCGLVSGGFAALVFHCAGHFLRAQGQILLSSLDATVFLCPFISDDHKIELTLGRDFLPKE